MKRTDTQGFTLVEILIVSVIVVMIIGSITALTVQFKRSFTKGEETSVIMQESGMFLALLRNDLINAVMDKSIPPEQWTKAIVSTDDRLAFTIFRDAEGTIEPVVYSYDWKTGAKGGSISRAQGNNRARIIVDQRVASLSWKVESDVVTGLATGTRQIWLSLDLSLGGQGKEGIQSKKIRVSTNLFPTRMNKQINGFP
jgi:type II secretory pathway pseudopilin PulG